MTETELKKAYDDIVAEADKTGISELMALYGRYAELSKTSLEYLMWTGPPTLISAADNTSVQA